MGYTNDALGHLRQAANALPFVPSAANRLQEYWNLGANGEGYPPYTKIMREVDGLIGKLKHLRAELQELESHVHDWNDDDYCSICGADGRA